MTDALEDHEGTVSIRGRTITNLRFANNIDGLAGEEEEMENLVERLDKASTACGMEVSAEKTKLMTNITSGINTEIKVNGQRLETVTSFKYLGSVITDEVSKPEILSSIAQTTAALTRLKPVWIDKSISLSSKIRLMYSLFTYNCSYTQNVKKVLVKVFTYRFYCVYKPQNSWEVNLVYFSLFFVRQQRWIARLSPLRQLI